MRADRLVATLLLLQSRGRLTSAQVAAEREVSERTAMPCSWSPAPPARGGRRCAPHCASSSRRFRRRCGRAPRRRAPRAVVDGRQVLLGYTSRGKPASERVVSSLGLVDKAGIWYLVAGTDAGVRTFRVSRVTDVSRTADPVIRPEGFDLPATWAQAATEVEQRRGTERVVALVDPAILAALGWLLRSRLLIGETEPDGRVRVEMTGPSVRFIAAAVAGFGARVEVTAPADARAHLAAVGEELRTLYHPDAPVVSPPAR